MMSKKEYIQEVIEYLRGLSDGTLLPNRRDHGLCNELENRFDIEICGRKFWLELPSSSGDAIFPVKDPMHSPMRAYTTTLDLWGNNEYGDNRRELCDELADWFEDNLLQLIK